MATPELFEHPLAEEIIAYQRMQDDLEREFYGRWVVINKEKLVGESYESTGKQRQLLDQWGWIY